MSVSSYGVLDQLDATSKRTIQNLAIDVKDLIDKVDLNDSLSKV